MDDDKSVDQPKYTGVQLSSIYKLQDQNSVRHDGFFSEFDYCMVFPMEKVKGSEVLVQSTVAKFCINVMLEQHLELFSYLSVQGDELLVLIKCPDEVLSQFADDFDFKMLCDPIELESLLLEGNEEAEVASVRIAHNIEISTINPFQYVHLKYDKGVPRSLYQVEPTSQKFMANSRLKLVYYLLKAPRRSGGCDFEISKLLHKKKMLAFYPLHECQKALKLLNKCVNYRTLPWMQPFDELRAYFGEKWTLYVLFLSHYTYYLRIPSMVGLAFQLVVWGSGNFSHPVLPFYGVVITVWTIVMLEFWKRKEKYTGLKWGMIGFEDTEPDRPEYQGTMIKSYVNGRWMLYFPPAKINERVAASMVAIGALIMTVIGVVAGIYYMRFSLQSKIGSVASTVASIVNSVQIQVFNTIYQIVARKLTDIENHRTDTQYQDSLITKLFMFQFVNSYASFFFLAFIATYLPKPAGVDPTFVGQCGFSNCMQPLSINLAIIFGTRLIVGNLTDILSPYFTYTGKLKAERKGAEDKILTPAEEDYMLTISDPMYDNINNYADTVIQFGFMVFFITALPCACFFSMVNNYVKCRVMAWKSFQIDQRPIPMGAEDIGAWQSIFTIMSVVSVMTNAGLICFTMNVLTDQAIQLQYEGKLWIFIGFQWVLIFLQFAVAEAIPDEPAEVTIQLERIEFINEKLIEKIADEDFDEQMAMFRKESDRKEGEEEAEGGGLEFEDSEESPLGLPPPPPPLPVDPNCMPSAECVANCSGCLPKKEKKLKQATKKMVGGDALAPFPVQMYPLDGEDVMIMTNETLEDLRKVAAEIAAENARIASENAAAQAVFAVAESGDAAPPQFFDNPMAAAKKKAVFEIEQAAAAAAGLPPVVSVLSAVTSPDEPVVAAALPPPPPAADDDDNA